MRDSPDVNASDDEIRWYAREHNVLNVPVFYVPLSYAVSPDQPDLARVDFIGRALSDCPVTRMSTKDFY